MSQELGIALLVILLLVVIFGGYAYSRQNGRNIVTPIPTTLAPIDTSTPTPTLSGAVTPSLQGVSIQNNQFSPSMLTIAVGSTVEWVNNDNIAHSVVSSSFKSGEIPPNGTFVHTFDQAGTYAYSCGIHPTMTGTIIVQ